METFSRQVFNTILIHTSRTWERVRINHFEEEMPIDNIASTEVIEHIAFEIFNMNIIQNFISASDKNNYWINNTQEGMSDLFIEATAENIILKQYK